MDAETGVKPEERKGSFLGIIVMVFVGLVGVGLIGLGSFAWFIVSEMARVRGGNAGGMKLFFLAIVAGGAALVISVGWRAALKYRSKGHR
jgi:hypothetical protein